MVPRTGNITMSTCEFVIVSICMKPDSIFFCSRFADRDMFMRFRGGGIGHKGIRAAQRKLAEDSNDQSGTSDMDVEMEDNGDSVAHSMATAAVGQEDGEESDGENDDYGYNYDDNRTEYGEGDEEEDHDEDNFGEDDLGAEDGEGPADIAEENDYDYL
jgi:hypothetical protein